MTKTEEEKDEVEEFLKKRHIFPCLIKSNGGKIELNFDGFENEKIPIQKIQENSFVVTYQESKQDFRIIVDKDLSEDLSLYGNSFKFDGKIKGTTESSSSKQLFVGEYKLYSLNIKQEDLSFSKYYIDKFQQIANNSLLDEEKSKQLEEIFKITGYYIPKKIYIGGMLISHTNQFTQSQNNSLDFSINTNINLNNSNLSASKRSKFNEIYNSTSTQKIGGDCSSSKTFEDWIKSINLQNSNVIECCNIIKAINILDNDLQKQLERPLKLIDEKYERRKKFLKYFNQINQNKNEKLCGKKGYGNFNRGLIETKNKSDEPRITMQYFKIFSPTSFFPPIHYEEFHREFNDIYIIGFEIIDNRLDSHNGQWTIKNEPLGSQGITIEFASGFLREQDFTVNIYLMEVPE